MARVWVLKRNCSITPRQLASVYAILSAVSLMIAIGFGLHGVWAILPFSLLELAAVGGALLIYARHATDQERIAVEDGLLHVWLASSGDTQHTIMNLQQARIVSRGSRRGLVRLEAAGRQVAVGRFLTEWKRRELAEELAEALAAELAAALASEMAAGLQPAPLRV